MGRNYKKDQTKERSRATPVANEASLMAQWKEPTRKLLNWRVRNWGPSWKALAYSQWDYLEQVAQMATLMALRTHNPTGGCTLNTWISVQLMGALNLWICQQLPRYVQKNPNLFADATPDEIDAAHNYENDPADALDGDKLHRQVLSRFLNSTHKPTRVCAMRLQGKNFREIAAKEGVSHQRIEQLCRRNQEKFMALLYKTLPEFGENGIYASL